MTKSPGNFCFQGGFQKYFKKDIATECSFDKLRAPRRPKGFEDSVVCEPITEFPATGQD
jgi:hypothetical protein